MSAKMPDSPAGEERGRNALRSLGEEIQTPPRLRARVEAERDRTRRGPRRWPALGAVAAGVAAVAIALAVLPGGAPTVTEAGELGAKAAEGSAPQPRADEPVLLAAEQDGLAFPNWEPEFGWRAEGTREDELDGRETTTVFYEKADARLAYTIVSGEALEGPDGATTSAVEGVEFTSFRADGENAVTWLRDGHTCVLVGEGVDADTLVELAAWKGDGAVAF
jgi:hypothetical protein